MLAPVVVVASTWSTMGTEMGVDLKVSALSVCGAGGWAELKYDDEEGRFSWES
jgi:hypothetical protein